MTTHEACLYENLFTVRLIRRALWNLHMMEEGVQHIPYAERDVVFGFIKKWEERIGSEIKVVDVPKVGEEDGVSKS